MSNLFRFPCGVLLAGLTLPAMAADETYGWEAAPPSVQLYGDESVVPDGQGAIFVPMLTTSEDEPELLIVDADGVVKAPTGRRVLLDPGAYVVLVGTGNPDQRVGVEVVVQEGKTTVVPVRWGGLRVEAVSKRLKPRPDSYELVRMDDGKRVEIPAEFQEDGLSRPKTWLLEPGLYRLQEEGSGGVKAPVFTTVYVPEGALVNQRLFVDRSGAIKGGGVIPSSEYEDLAVEKSQWRSKLVLGLDGSGTQTKNVAGFPDLTVADGSAFLDLDVGYQSNRTALDFGVSAAYGLLLLEPATGEPLPLIKSRDELRADAAYTLRLNPGAGLYVRGAGQTQMTDTFAIATEDSVIEYRELDGTIRTEAVTAPKTYQIADAFKPLEVHTGAGLEVRLSTFQDVDLSLRGGVGYRYLQYGSAYVPTDNPNTDAIEYTAIADFAKPGLEAGASAGFRLTGFANWDTRLDLFTAFDGTGGVFAVWDNTLSVRLTRAVSLNYSLNATRQPWVSDRIALRQGAYVRFALNVL